MSVSLNLPTGAKASAILGIGGYRPRRVVDNAEIITYIDSSDEWIRTRSGIVERRWASPDETIQMMSVSAARAALERSGIEPGQIDTVIVSTVTHLHQTPAVATTIATELGAQGAAAFDISAACAGWWARWPRRSAGTCASPPWPTSASPVCWRCRPPAR